MAADFAVVELLAVLVVLAVALEPAPTPLMICVPLRVGPSKALEGVVLFTVPFQQNSLKH